MDLNEHTDTVISYISFCEDMCVQTKPVHIQHKKPWFPLDEKALWIVFRPGIYLDVGVIYQACFLQLFQAE